MGMGCILCLLCAATSGLAGSMPFAVVSGNFIYARAGAGGQESSISYQVEAANYHGIEAWRIAWSDARMDAVHYIRRGDGAPLYTRRVNHVRQETVQISYSLDPAKPHIYRRETPNETLVRRIHQPGLIDMGTLPQVLSGLQATRESGKLRFFAIDYSDGQVYALVARRVGYAKLANAGAGVRCAIYEANLDSWKAAFNPAVHLDVPTRAGLANFAAYSGPDPAGSGEITTLRMLSRSSDVAALSVAGKAVLAH